MAQAARYLLGVHDFSAFRAGQCQANSPIKEMHHLRVTLYFKDDKLDHFDGGNLPSEREYIARIAGPALVKEQIAPPADAPPKSTLPQK